MPISTDDPVWENGSDYEHTSNKVIQFLSNNSSKAYRIREIADEITDTKWYAGEAEDQFIQEIGEDEYFDNYQQYRQQLEEQLEETQENVTLDSITTADLNIIVSELVKEGLVESRNVDGRQIDDIPYDWEKATFYTYALD